MESYNPQPRYYNINKEPIIGKNCSLVNTLFDCAEQITIGDNVSFGHDCKVLTGSHLYTEKGAIRMLASINKPVIIEDGVWIASGAIICQGVTIGENSVIGAGSVVTHNIPRNVLAAGNPCEIIKEI